MHIRLAYEPQKVVIAVHEDGKGIDNADIIFDRFSKGADGNFGLGLSIAKASMEKMQGEIKVRSVNGALFEVILHAQ